MQQCEEYDSDLELLIFHQDPAQCLKMNNAIVYMTSQENLL